MAFTHLHLYTEYNLLDSAVKIKELVDYVKASKMDSVAISDSGVLFAAVEFYQLAKKVGIKPIIACKLNVESFLSPTSKDVYQLLLIVENKTGYQNLIKMLSNNFSQDGSVLSKEMLKAHSQGLIALSAGIEGEIANLLLNNKENEALEVARQYKQIFGADNFFLEIQDHGLKIEKLYNKLALKLSESLKIELVATNAVRYLKQSDSKVYAALSSIKNGNNIIDNESNNCHYYLKSAKEMEELFNYIPSAIVNTEKIAHRITFDFDFNTRHLPRFPLENNLSSSQYLRSLCQKALSIYYPDDNGKASKRLQNELKTIIDMGFEDYFLITWDFVKFAKEKGILVGACRGSAGGSIVAYLLNITEVDPLKYGLIFERFLNPERITMPDIDIDFQDDRRQEVIDYVIAKYGKEHVAQIITFGSLGARAAIRDMGRVLSLPNALIDKVAKLIEPKPKITLLDSLEKNLELRSLYQRDDVVKYLIDMALSVEGFPRHTSTHAAGIVISSPPLSNLIPLYRSDDSLITQYDMEKLEELGLLKIDLLGLSTLTVIQNCLKLIKLTTGKSIDFQRHNYTDKKTFQLFSSGMTLGLFQLESKGMVRFLRAYKPKTLEDIIAAISLYRPGPMDSIDKYLKNKQNPKQINYIAPQLKPILDITYGCLVYQEQVMQIVRDLAGYSYGRSDLVRRAMSKKKLVVMERERETFIDGCLHRGLTTEQANLIFDDMVDFAKYAFNKSHAAGYAMIAYQTAYLKQHYPACFLAACLTSHIHSQRKIGLYCEEARRLNVEILAPDIRFSNHNFSVERGAIRFALSAIKNVGKNLAKSIVKERECGEFRDFEDFVLRLSVYELNKNALESLIKVGACDGLGENRATLLLNFEQLFSNAQARQRRNAIGQLSLLDDGEGQLVSAYKYKRASAFSDKKKLDFEQELTGISFTQKKRVEQVLYLRLPVINRVEAQFIKNWALDYSGDKKLVIYQSRSEKSSVYVRKIAITSSSLSALTKRYGKENIVIKNNK